jgi:hypothetical protein
MARHTHRYGTEDRGINKSMNVPADETHDEVVAAYRKACARSTRFASPAPRSGRR